MAIRIAQVGNFVDYEGVFGIEMWCYKVCLLRLIELCEDKPAVTRGFEPIALEAGELKYSH